MARDVAMRELCELIVDCPHSRPSGQSRESSFSEATTFVTDG
jgi:hypothetical protein